MTDGRLTPSGPGPALEPENLTVKLWRECTGPWAKFLGDEFLEDFRQRPLLPDVLIAGCLVDEANDADRRQPSDQNVGALRNMGLTRVEHTRVTRFQHDIA